MLVIVMTLDFPVLPENRRTLRDATESAGHLYRAQDGSRNDMESKSASAQCCGFLIIILKTYLWAEYMRRMYTGVYQIFTSSAIAHTDLQFIQVSYIFLQFSYTALWYV